MNNNGRNKNLFYRFNTKQRKKFIGILNGKKSKTNEKFLE